MPVQTRALPLFEMASLKVPRSKGNPSHSIGQAAGNYVVLRVANRRYVFYEHLRPGSVRVRVGDHVSRDQIIGNLGFTGESTGPHLHLHVADGVDPLNAEGLPFVFDRFEELGRFPNIGDLGKKRWQTDKKRRGTDKVPRMACSEYRYRI